MAPHRHQPQRLYMVDELNLRPASQTHQNRSQTT
jgi:hypothetical protein